MYNPAELKRKTLAHYIELAANPAWKDYCWHQVKCLAKENPAMYWDLPEKLKDAMQKRLSDEQLKAGK
jgi:hypothetical protein